MDVRRALLRAWELWYPIVFQLHRPMVAVARFSVNHDGKGGSARDPLVWDQGSRAKQRRVNIGFFVDLATLRGPLCFLCGRSVQVNGGFITGADVAASPYCVRLLWVFILSGFASLAS